MKVFSRKAAKLFWRLHNLPKPTAERPAPALLGPSPSLSQSPVAVPEVQPGAVSSRDELRPFCFWCALEAEQNGQPAERRGLRFIENCVRHRDNVEAAQSLFGLVA